MALGNLDADSGFDGCHPALHQHSSHRAALFKFKDMGTQDSAMLPGIMTGNVHVLTGFRVDLRPARLAS